MPTRTVWCYNCCRHDVPGRYSAYPYSDGDAAGHYCDDCLSNVGREEGDACPKCRTYRRDGPDGWCWCKEAAHAE